MEAQRQRLLGERGQKKVHRPELEAKHGYDTKYAMHMLRLGFQGVELMQTGRLVLPMVEGTREFLMDVRYGRIELDAVLTMAGNLERSLKDLINTSPIPAEPNEEAVQDWMIRTYWENWKAR